MTSMRTAVAEVVRLGGGAVVARGGEVLAGLPLPYAGLISDRASELRSEDSSTSWLRPRAVAGVITRTR